VKLVAVKLMPMMIVVDYLVSIVICLIFLFNLSISKAGRAGGLQNIGIDIRRAVVCIYLWSILRYSFTMGICYPRVCKRAYNIGVRNVVVR